MKLRTMLAAMSLLALPLAAHAQPVDGLYVGGGVGYNLLQNQVLRNAGAGALNNLRVGTLKGNGGILGQASLGYGFGNGFRLELEGNYRNDAQAKGTGKVHNQTYGGFANALYDFDVGSSFVYPYIGAGVGYLDENLRNGHTAGAKDAAGAVIVPATTFSGTKGDAGAQGILGVAFPISGVTGLSVTAEYRYMTSFSQLTFSNATKVTSQSNHAGILGLRYAFGIEAPAAAPAPAPAPAAAPVAAPARTYLVFFDWDKADLSDRARQIITEAAQNVAKVQVTRIEVAGHADRSGTPAYNQKLSLKRAQNVAAELVRQGVPQNEIDIQAFGDTKPLVPTAAGVREPQNRRVEIVLK